MNAARIFEVEYLGIKTIEFECGGYEGAFTIDGANLVKLKYLPKNLNLMHTTYDADALSTKYIYGMPILFFPNRIKDGTFTFEGKTYKFPINDAANNVHLHGFFNGYTKWTLAKKDVTDNFINLTFEYIIDENDEIYNYFDFKVKISYENIITSSGLFQRMSFENMSDKNMPFGFAYHTTFNIPFNDSPREAFFVTANLKYSYVNEVGIPTGELLPLAEYEKAANTETGIQICKQTLDTLYLADDSVPNVATIIYTATNTQLVYEADSKFKHWIIYNLDKDQKFLSIEPQTCCSNAVNSDMDTANLLVVKPGEEISLSTKIYIKN